MPKHTLAVDIETYSETDLKKCGVWKYAQDSKFEVLIICYKIDNEPTQTLDLNSIFEIAWFTELLLDPEYEKTAFNASFERVCLMRWFNIYLDPVQWSCTMALAYTCGMSGGLDMVAQILRIPGKLYEGKNLISYFCVPRKPTKHDKRTRIYPTDDPQNFELFVKYCVRDVDVEYSIRQRLANAPMGYKEKAIWALDQKINDKGIRLDTQFIEDAIKINDTYSAWVLDEARELTGLENPKSIKQLKKWLEEELDEEISEYEYIRQTTGVTPSYLKPSEENAADLEIKDLSKNSVKDIIAAVKSDKVKEVLALRQRMSKTSISKYKAMMRVQHAGVVRHVLQYGGAARTLRWAGRILQPHNLAKSELDDIDMARRCVIGGDAEWMDSIYDNIPDTLSKLIRTSFTASPGNRLIVSDFSAIEARVLAWLAGEQWRLDVFKGHGKIYEASAAAMFNIPIESVTKGSDYRQRGKVAELALGYQGSKGALITMGALRLGIPESDLMDIVNRWRAANPAIVQFWYTIQNATVAAVNNPGQTIRGVEDRDGNWRSLPSGITMQVKNSVLFITLPSGRRLCYLRPRMEEDSYGYGLTYEGKEKDGKKWGRQKTYGGKLVENIVQAISRDLLAEAMLRLDKRGYNIVLHVHDEVVMDMPFGIGSVEEVTDIMREPVPWSDGLPLNADSFETFYYKKD